MNSLTAYPSLMILVVFYGCTIESYPNKSYPTTNVPTPITTSQISPAIPSVYRSIFARSESFPKMPGAVVWLKNKPLKGDSRTITLKTKKSLPEAHEYYSVVLRELGCVETSNEITERAFSLFFQCVPGYENDVWVNGTDWAYVGSEDFRSIQLDFKVSSVTRSISDRK